MPVQPKFDMTKGVPVIRVVAWSDIGKSENSEPQ
jgi:hypothetical protein